MSRSWLYAMPCSLPPPPPSPALPPQPTHTPTPHPLTTPTFLPSPLGVLSVLLIEHAKKTLPSSCHHSNQGELFTPKSRTISATDLWGRKGGTEGYTWSVNRGDTGVCSESSDLACGECVNRSISTALLPLRDSSGLAFR